MIADKNTGKTQKELSYVLKVWQTVAIIALLVVTILVIRVAFNVLLMAMAGFLIAVYFHGLADMIERRTKLKHTFAMIISITGSFILIGVVLWFIGSKIVTQVGELSNTLPHTVHTAKARLAETSIGQKILEYTSDDNSNKLGTAMAGFFSTSFGVMGDLYIILFLGIFFTAHPSLYKDGILLMVPKARKPLAKHILDRISLSLKGWLKGMLMSMVLIIILLSIGLSIMGIPVALVLSLITGILELIPNIGSLVAMIPGVLLALTISTNTAIIVAIIYIVCQTIVANIVRPLIQKKMINLPPALTLISQLIMGSVSGALGIVLAVPLLAILIILIDELYVKKINDHYAPALDKRSLS
jgi:predicted PurR-regulated permease PerM